MPALELAFETIPLWWTTDFINASFPGTAPANEKWIVGKFNCSCVGISKCPAAYCKDDAPTACLTDIAPEDLAEAERMGNLMGKKAHGILSRSLPDTSILKQVATDDLGLLPQPPKPVFKTALARIYVRRAKYGGADKSSNGHRYDSVPIVNGMIGTGMSCQLVRGF
jgi:hypothetical protein